jgi:CheY-like chemotaxis protein
MIAVVEDHADTADIIFRLLRREGHEVKVFTSGEELLGHLERTEDAEPPPQVNVLDMAMPGIGGMECLRALAGDERWRDIAVVVYSADFTSSCMLQALELGAKDFLVKGTIGWDVLVRTVEKHTGLSSNQFSRRPMDYRSDCC